MSSPWVPRVLLGVGLAGLIGAIISLSVGTGGPKVIKITGGDAVQELLGGVQQNGTSLGDPNAPVTVALFPTRRLASSKGAAVSCGAKST